MWATHTRALDPLTSLTGVTKPRFLTSLIVPLPTQGSFVGGTWNHPFFHLYAKEEAFRHSVVHKGIDLGHRPKYVTPRKQSLKLEGSSFVLSPQHTPLTTLSFVGQPTTGNCPALGLSARRVQSRPKQTKGAGAASSSTQTHLSTSLRKIPHQDISLPLPRLNSQL
jgi:hypothetical protein